MGHESRVAASPCAHAHADRVSVVVGIDGRLGEPVLRVVEVELAEAGVVQAVVGPEVGNPGGAARLPAIGRDVDLVVEVVLQRVGAHEDLVRAAAGEPRPVAVVTVRRALVPGTAAVGRREERVVDEVDPGVVETAAVVHRQVGIAEARVGRGRRALRAQVAVSEPVDAAVRRRPDVHLVAVVDEEVEVAPRGAEQASAIQVRRPFVGRVHERAVERVGHHARLAARELLVDVDGRSEDGRSRRRPSGACSRTRADNEDHQSNRRQALHRLTPSWLPRKL